MDSLMLLTGKLGIERVAVVAMAVEMVVLVGNNGPAVVRRGATNGRANGTPAAAPPPPTAEKYDERVSATDAAFFSRKNVVAVPVAIPEVKVGVICPTGGWGCPHETGGGAATAAAAVAVAAAGGEEASSTRGVVKVVACDEEAS